MNGAATAKAAVALKCLMQSPAGSRVMNGAATAKAAGALMSLM